MEMLASDALSVLAITLSLAISALFAAAESAITTLGALRARHLLESQGKRAKSLQTWVDDPHRVLTTILVFNRGLNIFAIAFATEIALRYFPESGAYLSAGMMALVVLIFCEVLPKSLARAHAESVSIFSMKVMNVLAYPAFPLAWLLTQINNRFIRFAGAENLTPPAITEEELEFLVDEGQKAGAIHEFKKDMIDGIFEFDETKVREIMTPRTDITAIGMHQLLRDAVKLSIETGYSRLPVYEDRIDNIIGVILIKDLLRYGAAGIDSTSEIRVKKAMREAYFVPESKMIVDVFKDLKRTKNHMAIVIDEYGGTAGLVTMEDIIEEIVGEIQDEYDVEEAKILEIGSDSYDVSGSVNIDEFLDFFEVDATTLTIEREQDVATIAGWLTQLLGDMPKIGQTASIGPLQIEVTEVERHRIQRVRVFKTVQETKAEEPEGLAANTEEG